MTSPRDFQTSHSDEDHPRYAFSGRFLPENKLLQIVYILLQPL